MASAGQESNAVGPPPRLSRYRSTRKAQAQQAVANAASIEPALPPTDSAANGNHINSTQRAEPPQRANSNPASSNTFVSPNEAPALPEDPSAHGQSIQRSMSRYRKVQKPTAASASPVPVPPLHLPHVTSDPAGGQVADVAPPLSKDQRRVKLVTREHNTREARFVEDNGATRPARSPQEPSAPDSTELPSAGSNLALQPRSAQPQSSAFGQPQPTDGTVPLQTSKSRYRRPAPTKQESAPNMRTTVRPADPSATLPSKLKQEHREAIRKIQKQAQIATPISTEQPYLPRSLTKASLDQVPDANKNDNENYLNQIMAITRQSTLESQKKIELPKAPRAHASRAQNEVRKLMDAEAERQRRMQEKIKMEREKAKAEEEAQAKAKREEEERKVAEKRQREEKEREEKAAAMAAAREQREFEKAERRKKGLLGDQLLPKRHQRKESREERVERHRNRSLSALEGNESRKRSSPEDSQVQSVPAVPKEALGFFKKRRDEPPPKGMVGVSKEVDQKTKEEVNIRPGGGGIVPGVDAPISAVNAGDRRVLVECNQSSIYLPVTTTTTSVDLIRSAATCLNESINAKASVLLESFGKVGVQRPLRKYEHIRDVMNSWDDDRQNSLILMPSATGGADADLEDTSVAAEQPEEVSFQLHYSQRPGKWEKKLFTLRSDGQVVSAKSEGHKDVTNVCHMSDFDIYTPHQQQLTKKIRPPKKICFAIKSQQKSNMFMSTENFVHFFSTGDKQTAAAWYKAIQGWRSWYLVNVMGEGTRPLLKNEKSGAPMLPDITVTEQKRPGSQESHYQLGSFKPLLDFDAFGFTTDKPHLSDLGIASHARNKVSKSSAAHIRDPSRSVEDDTFAPTGLLGRSYSTRQRANKDNEQALTAGPFTGGLLDNQVRPSTDHGRPSLADLARSGSNARHAKPLVDLTPGYQDPPQHVRKGRGFVPEQVGPGGLIDSATSPDVAIQIPPSSDWRARATAGGDESGSSGLTRNRSIRRPDDPSKTPFAADGLLGTTPAGQGDGTTGRGVMDGSKVRMSQGMGPMLDMNIRSNFVDGSLLRKVEAEESPRLPIIERAKGEEIVVGTGEGF